MLTMTSAISLASSAEADMLHACEFHTAWSKLTIYNVNRRQAEAAPELT
jgi:hypothetical protein